jgi:GWxTD domain-containing protein
MTLLESWVHTPLAQSLGFALAHSLWEGVLIAAVLAAALCVARSSRARYGAACAAMLLMLASFGVTLVRLMPRPAGLAQGPRPFIGVPAPPAALPIAPLPPPESLTLSGLLPWIAPFWAAGVLFFYIRSFGGWMAARHLRRSGVCRAPGDWQRRLDALAARLRVSKPVALLESCLAEVPVVMGYARPVILMPVGLLAGLPVAQVEAILIHELAHIRRQDYLVNLMQTFVEGLLFYHPAVWWISGAIRAERENCCDDLAVAATGDARQYAVALAALEQYRGAASDLALAANGGNLVKRIRRLLQQPERPRAVWTPVFSASLLVVGAGIALASWQTTPTPKPRSSVPVSIPPPIVSPAADADANRVLIWNRVPPAAKPAAVLLAEAPQSQRTPAAQSVAEQLKAQLQAELATRQDIATPYKKWLNEDVAYIITGEERKTFKALTTDEEREQFIDEFWLRRDPTPATPFNEFKQEHYRRIAYANEQFSTAAGLPGWKTDRGRIYITFGPPDEIEDRSAGGFYERPPEEGGGATTTYPFQQWRYRFLDGIGSNIVIEFVDPASTKEFRMTKDPSEKEARSLPSATNAGNVFVSVGDGPKVTVSVTSGKRNAGVNVALPSGSAKYDVIARITDSNGKTAANMRDVTASGQLNYPSAFALPSGSYTLDLVIRDQTSGAMQTSSVSFYVN